jgi:hypothetical protein
MHQCEWTWREHSCEQETNNSLTLISSKDSQQTTACARSKSWV